MESILYFLYHGRLYYKIMFINSTSVNSSSRRHIRSPGCRYQWHNIILPTFIDNKIHYEKRHFMIFQGCNDSSCRSTSSFFIANIAQALLSLLLKIVFLPEVSLSISLRRCFLFYARTVDKSKFLLSLVDIRQQ